VAQRAAPPGDVSDFCDSSGLEVGHSFTARNVERHRSLVVRDQPIAVDLPEAESGQLGVGEMTWPSSAAVIFDAVTRSRWTPPSGRAIMNLPEGQTGS
jgi:hypothetical protein